MKSSRFFILLEAYFIENFFQKTKFKPHTFGYKVIVENKKYKIMERPFLKRKIVAAFNKTVVTLNVKTGNNIIKIYPNYFTRLIRYRIRLNKRNFPGLIDKSHIMQCILIPYMRNTTGNDFHKSLRLVVITDKCQIYHNYPARNKIFDGVSQYFDISRFEESAVWDLPERKYPSDNISCAPCEYYFPCLPKSSYEYHPVINTASFFRDHYKNGGFGKTVKVEYRGKEVDAPRFYFPLRNEEQSNSFHHIGGAATDYKMTLLGTYRSNTTEGVRTAVFGSDDGGRNWFCKYEFGDLGQYEFNQKMGQIGRNFGNPINTKNIETEYRSSTLSILKRDLIIPTQQEKEPINHFRWSEKIKIKNITRANMAIVTTQNPHGLITGNIICIIKDDECDNTPWDWICNNSISQKSAGNGILFKVDVINDKSFQLYEFVASPFNNITCRHIHHINRIKDGWILGTGEIYPNGWLFYIQMKEADTYTPKKANSEFTIVRLSSSVNSVQRTMGLILKDDEQSTVIYASDHDLLERKNIMMPEGRTDVISRSATGVYMGTLKDIDNINKFKVIFEATEPCFFFKDCNGVLVFCGQRGEFAISLNFGLTWQKSRITHPVIYYGGETNHFFVLDEYILILK